MNREDRREIVKAIAKMARASGWCAEVNEAGWVCTEDREHLGLHKARLGAGGPPVCEWP